MEIPEFEDILYWVRVDDWVGNKASGEVQHPVQFPSTSLTATTKYIMIDGREYDLFASKQGHWYIVVNYKLQ